MSSLLKSWRWANRRTQRMKREVTWCERGRFQTRKAHKIVHVSRGNSSSEREEGSQSAPPGPAEWVWGNVSLRWVATRLTSHSAAVFFGSLPSSLQWKSKGRWNSSDSSSLYQLFPPGQNNSRTILSPLLVFSSSAKKLELLILTSTARQVTIIIILNFYVIAKGYKEFINSADSGL